MNRFQAMPTADDRAIIALHHEMAQLRYDHARANRTTALLIIFLPLLVALLAAELLAGLYLFLVLTFVVVLTALCL